MWLRVRLLGYPRQTVVVVSRSAHHDLIRQGGASVALWLHFRSEEYTQLWLTVDAV